MSSVGAGATPAESLDVPGGTVAGRAPVAGPPTETLRLTSASSLCGCGCGWPLGPAASITPALGSAGGVRPPPPTCGPVLIPTAEADDDSRTNPERGNVSGVSGRCDRVSGASPAVLPRRASAGKSADAAPTGGGWTRDPRGLASADELRIRAASGGCNIPGFWAASEDVAAASASASGSLPMTGTRRGRPSEGSPCRSIGKALPSGGTGSSAPSNAGSCSSKVVIPKKSGRPDAASPACSPEASAPGASATTGNERPDCP